jgi:hypothetical protein
MLIYRERVNPTYILLVEKTKQCLLCVYVRLFSSLFSLTYFFLNVGANAQCFIKKNLFFLASVLAFFSL